MLPFYRFPRPPSSTLFPYTTLFRSQRDQPIELEEARRSLDRVEGPHDRLRRIAVVGFSLQHEQRRLRALDVFARDRKSTRLNSSHPSISYAVFCLKKKKQSMNAACI